MPLHLSVPVENTMQPINATEVSPLISKCYVKVLYVGEQPNRNGTVITKEVATEMGRKLPGSPIVGYFDKESNDFDTHNRELIVKNGDYELVDITRPYGFVPTDANIWFEKFNDNGVEREYLVTEAYIWTGAYPESQRIVDRGNNQSMELTRDKGFWTNLGNESARVFIYNEALIEKLCVLGEDVEPCFEGAQIKAFSLEESEEFKQFKRTMYAMIETMNKGGSTNMDNPMNENQAPENQFASNPKEEEKEKDKKEEPDTKKENNSEDKDKKENDKDKDKKKYNLDEVVEYQDLLNKYNALQSQYSALQEEKQKLDNEINGLRQFKLTTDRANKQSMIDSFYMLTDEQKKDVIDNMDTYSLDDIEAKLSIICVRNKVNFSQDTADTQEESKPQGMFNLNGAEDNVDPWIKAVQAKSQN